MKIKSFVINNDEKTKLGKIFIFFCVIIFSFSSCKSVSMKKENANLCLLIVDDKNNPIKDFSVEIKNEKKLIIYQAATNEKGFCAFNEIENCEYELCAKKNGYRIIETKIKNPIDSCKIYCFETTDCETVFTEAEKLFSIGQYDIALNLLEQIYFEQNSPISKVVSVYQKFGNEQKNKGVQSNEE